MARKHSNDNVELFHDKGIYLPTRTIYMGSVEHSIDSGESGCDGAMAERAIKNLNILDSMSDEPITILMNNIGGDEYHCFAIIDAIQACRSSVVCKVMGHAMSAGSLILQYCDERIMGPLSVQMIHYGTWGANDHSKTFQKWAKEGARVDKWMEEMYLAKIQEKHPTFKISKLRQLLDHDTFLTAEESVALGLADKILGDE